MLNSGAIMGRLVADPELRYTGSGTPVCSFTIANERDYSGGGEKVADFYDCVAWRGIGEFIAKYFYKGNMIAIHYHLSTSRWEDKNGSKRKNVELVVDSAYFCEKKSSGDASQAPVSGGFQEVDEDDENLPF